MSHAKREKWAIRSGHCLFTGSLSNNSGHWFFVLNYIVILLTVVKQQNGIP